MSNKRDIFLGASLIGLSATLWGLDGVALTPNLSNLDISFVVFILHFIPFLLMTLFLSKSLKSFRDLNRVELLSVIFVAVFGGVIGTLAIVKALFLVNFKSLSIVVLLQKLQPIFAILLATTFLKEKLRTGYVKWAIVALSAGYFLTFGLNFPNFSLEDDNFMASNYALLAAFSFGASTVFGKKAISKLSFSTLTYMRYGIASIVTLAIVLFNQSYGEFANMTQENWIVVILISLTSGTSSMLLYYYGLKKVKAIIATIMELFYPISAVFFDYLVNGNLLTSTQIIAAIVMVYAIINLNTENVRAIARIRIKMRKVRRKYN
jgi:drug/metabolite transporter (DMT)-like permease